MARTQNTAGEIVEVWEAMTSGTVYVAVFDKRDDRYVMTSVSGRSGAKKLRIPRDDRIYNQERIPEENVHLDPFQNGQLRRVDDGPVDDSLTAASQLTDADLAELLALKDKDLFGAEIERIKSELILRRLQSVAETDGAKWQLDAIQTAVRERYPVGGTQRTAREIFEEERRAQLGVS